jgi:intracellular septation protein A
MLDVFLFALVGTLVVGTLIFIVASCLMAFCWLMDRLIDMDPLPRLGVVLVIIFVVFMGLGTIAKVAHNANVPANNSCELEER